MTIARCCLALACLAVAAMPANSDAQTAGTATASIPTQGGVGTGVIVPPSGVDPGMKIKTPRIPARSTPVIHPPHQAMDGKTVLVPR